eukprot:m.122002 g.122002  ORF g.122002 m.122002 type:complete len:357 (-) comp16213_c0_seq4:579-1649(-)
MQSSTTTPPPHHRPTHTHHPFLLLLEEVEVDDAVCWHGEREGAIAVEGDRLGLRLGRCVEDLNLRRRQIARRAPGGPQLLRVGEGVVDAGHDGLGKGRHVGDSEGDGAGDGSHRVARDLVLRAEVGNEELQIICLGGGARLLGGHHADVGRLAHRVAHVGLQALVTRAVQQLEGAVDRLGHTLGGEEAKAILEGHAREPLLLKDVGEGPPGEEVDLVEQADVADDKGGPISAVAVVAVFKAVIVLGEEEGQAGGGGEVAGGLDVVGKAVLVVLAWRFGHALRVGRVEVRADKVDRQVHGLGVGDKVLQVLQLHGGRAADLQRRVHVLDGAGRGVVERDVVVRVVYAPQLVPDLEMP